MLSIKKLVQTGKKHRLLKPLVLAVLLTGMAVMDCVELLCLAFSKRSVRRVTAILTVVCVITAGLPMEGLAAADTGGSPGAAIHTDGSKEDGIKATDSDSRLPGSSQITVGDEETVSDEETIGDDVDLTDDVNIGESLDGSEDGQAATESESVSDGQNIGGGGGMMTLSMRS